MTTLIVIAVVIIILFVSLSLTLNVIFLRRLLGVSDNMDELLEVLTKFSNHLAEVYGMETFYGDKTLNDLLQHSKDVVSDVESFNDTYGGRPGDRNETETQTSQEN